MLLIIDHLQCTLVFDRAPQRTVEQAERLHRLPQVVARGCQEGAVGLVRTLGLATCRDDLILHLLALRNIPDDARSARLPQERGSG